MARNHAGSIAITAEELHEEVSAIVSEIGLKTVAFDLDLQPSLLAHALAGRERHFMRLDWLPYFVSKAKTPRLVAVLANLCGLELKPRTELTPTEKLTRVEQVLADCGPIGAELRRKMGI